MSKIAIDMYGNWTWFKGCKRHREDGPAVERISGIKEWYIDGINILKKNLTSIGS